MTDSTTLRDCTPSLILLDTERPIREADKVPCRLLVRLWRGNIFNIPGIRGVLLTDCAYDRRRIFASAMNSILATTFVSDIALCAIAFPE